MAGATVRSRAAFSLVEVVISTLLVGLVLVTSLQTLGAVLDRRNDAETTLEARALATQLLTEIVEKRYRAQFVSTQNGPETGETNRSGFDDIDDYQNGSALAPKWRDGANITVPNGWQYRVTVQFLAATDPPLNQLTTPGGLASAADAALSAPVTDTGIKLIIVEVFNSTGVLATATTICTDHEVLE